MDDRIGQEVAGVVTEALRLDGGFQKVICASRLQLKKQLKDYIAAAVG